jgi:DNA-3-methyladenine glycosylase
MHSSTYNKLNRIFYERDPLVVSRDLLGKLLVRKTERCEMVGEIVETEAYVGPHDKASHTYNNKRTKRTLVQFGERGHAYVFRIYGIYYCLCVVVGPQYTPAVTLIRAVRPIKGMELMIKNRKLNENSSIYELTNGPSKVCQAFEITCDLNGACLLDQALFLCEGKRSVFEIGNSARIGIDYAEECKNIPWRFYIKHNGFVS